MNLRALRGAARAELEQLARSRPFVALVFVEAITFLVLVSLFGLTGSRAPTALIDHDGGPLARSFVEHLKDAHHSFRLRPMTLPEAKRQIDKGEIVAIITIPRGFSDDIAHGRTVLLPVTVDNVNADMSDDIREGLPSAITAFGYNHGFPGVRLTAVEHDLIDHDTDYIPYLVVSSLALTAFVIAGILGAVAITREYEARTMTEWRLAPVHPGWLLAGKLLASAFVASLALALAALIVVFGYGIHPEHPVATFGVFLLSVPMFTCIGACVGVLIKRTLPVAVLFFGLALPLYIDSGADDPLRFDGEKLWRIGHTSPAYQVVGLIEWGFHGYAVTPESLLQNLIVLLVWAAVAVLVAAAVLGVAGGSRMKAIWAIARLDLSVWRRSPWAILAAIVPPLGMYVLIKVLTLSVTVQPVALVVQDRGPEAQRFARFIEADTESYLLHETSLPRAQKLLNQQRVAAVFVIPKGFDAAVAEGKAQVYYTLNNTDIDFSDDIRRSIDRSVASFDAPQLGASLEGHAGRAGLVVPNPYRIDIAETDLRNTDVPFETYQVLPVLLLLALSAGILGGALLGSRDHERGTIVLLRASPVGRWSFVAGRLLGTLLASATIVVPVTAYLAWKGTVDPPSGHWLPFLGVLVTTTVFAAAVGVLLGAAVRRATTVALAGVTVASYLFFLGGGFTTIAFLPEWLRTLSRAVPTRYAIDGMRQTLFYPDLINVGTDLALLTGFTLVALLGSVFVLGRAVR